MTLVIACGNPVRGDDGVGPAVAARLGMGQYPCTVVTVQALVPELAETVSRASRVVFVDARLNAETGIVSTESVTPTIADVATQGHSLTPGGVVGLAQQLYGWQGQAWLVTVSGGKFDYSNTLSAPVLAALPAAVDAVVSRIVPY